ncbi:MAG: MoaD/ThiS family protein [Halanaerobiales bacterium]|nr:MoaD/ThiS family protein [Halanaerobiales bacterium]
MMKVTVNLYAGLEKHLASGKRKGNIIELKEPARVLDLLEKIGIPPEKVAIIMVNGRHSHFEDRLEENEVVAFFPPLGGG